MAEYARQLPPAEYRLRAYLVQYILSVALYRSQPDRFAELAAVLSDDEKMMLIHELYFEVSSAQRTQLRQDFPDVIQSLLRGRASTYASQNPDLILELIFELPAADRQQPLVSFLQSLGREDPERAFALAQQNIELLQDQSWLLGSLIESLASGDPLRALALAEAEIAAGRKVDRGGIYREWASSGHRVTRWVPWITFCKT